MPKLTDAQAQDIIRYLRGLKEIESRGIKYSKSNRRDLKYENHSWTHKMCVVGDESNVLPTFFLDTYLQKTFPNFSLETVKPPPSTQNAYTNPFHVSRVDILAMLRKDHQ